MKINYNISLVGLLISLLMISSCDVINQTAEDFVELDQFFQEQGDAIAAVNAISSSAHFVKQGGAQFDLRPSDEYTNPTYWVIERQREINEWRLDGSNVEVPKHWREFYRLVVRSNMVIDRVEKMSSDQIDPFVKNWVRGEAYFWRADSYFNLMAQYGAVPIILTDNMDGLEADVPESSVEEVHDLIVSDLKEAERLLPPEFTGENIGRPVETSASAYLVRVYMQHSQWAEAAEYAKKVIDSGRHWLFDDFQNAFSPFHDNGPEHIWSYQIAAQPVGKGNNWAWHFIAPRGSTFLGGRPVLASYVPTIESFNVFEEGDYRRDVSFITEYVDEQGDTIHWSQFAAPVPHAYKLNDRRLSWEENQNMNRPVIRYADILLLYAEALNEMDQTGDALPYLNMVRERARNGDPSAPPQDYAPGMSQSEFRDAVRLERRLELVQEHIRFRDLQRWGTVVEAIRALSDPADGAPNPADFIQDHNILWPKPTSQIELNPGITQNPGYD